VRPPGRWIFSSDVVVALRSAGRLHEQLVMHVGSAAVPVHVRPLGAAARLRLARELPLRVGDVGLLRDPGEHRIAAGVEVLDVRPPALRRRGAARTRAEELATGRARSPVCARADELSAMGFPIEGQRVGAWVVDPQWWAERRQHMVTTLGAWSTQHDIAAGMPLETARQQVGLPAAELLPALLEGTGLEVVDGRVRQPGTTLPARVETALRTLREWLTTNSFRAPEADELAGLDLGPRELAAAVRAGRLTRIADGVVLGPDALEHAADVLKALPQPFTVADAKRALNTTRRVAVPLLEALDARHITRRADDSTRTMV
jgi:selenocysteine-specific elongation factor